MTDPKVSEKEMLDVLDKIAMLRMSWPYLPKIAPETVDAIRAAIEERGRLRKEMIEFKDLVDKILMATGRCDDCPLLEDIRDFKLDGEAVLPAKGK